jgi:hypothetical protein
MIRKDLLEKNALTYDDAFEAVEDYELWSRVLPVTRGANMRAPLVRYRVHSGSVTTKYDETRAINHDRVAQRNIRMQLPGFSISSENVRQLRETYIEWRRPRSRRSGVLDLNLARLYLDMFEFYTAQHGASKEVNAWFRRDKLKMLFFALSRPRWRTAGLACQLLYQDPAVLGVPVSRLSTILSGKFIQLGRTEPIRKTRPCVRSL